MHVSLGQTVRWIRMPLCTEVRHGPGHVVLDGDPDPPPKGEHPKFSQNSPNSEFTEFTDASMPSQTIYWHE